jgi:hypothetical protein
MEHLVIPLNLSALYSLVCYIKSKKNNLQKALIPLKRALKGVPLCWVCAIVLFAGCSSYTINPEDHPSARSSIFTGVEDNDGRIARTKQNSPLPVIAREPVLVQPTQPVGTADRSPRYALVIGNSRYSTMPLKNPANDATDIAAALKRLDFEVTLVTDADQRKMEETIRRFGKKLHPGTIGLFYYAGHAVQHDGENYLIPVDAVGAVSAADHLKYKTVAAGYVLGVMEEAGNGLNLVFLDACRDNPFRGFSRSATRGLARMDSPTGSLIAYSTSPGQVAQDGGANRNSPYTQSLLQYLMEPHLPINSMLIKVNAAVKRETNGQQVPWYSSSMEQDFYFVR